MVVTLPNKKPEKGKNSSWGAPSASSMPREFFGPSLGVDAQSAVEDSESFRKDLLRRGESAFPLPWRHGGLNE
jgi:hypothetical protein